MRSEDRAVVVGAGPVGLVTAVVAIILGMGMPTVGVYVIMAMLAAPALVQAHLFAMYFGMMSMVTPPVALAAVTAANPTPSPVKFRKPGKTIR